MTRDSIILQRARELISVSLAVAVVFSFAPDEALAADELRFTFEAASPAVLGNPHDLILDQKGAQLLVSDVNNDRIAILDANTLAVVGSIADGEVSEPHDVALGPDGRLYVADTGNSRIAIFDFDGIDARFSGELTDRLRRPEGVAVGSDGSVFASGASSNNVVAFDPNGVTLAETSGFSAPHDLALNADGDLWLADAGNNRVIRLTAELETSNVLQGSPFQFNGPRYLDIASDGLLFVADKYAHQIKIIDAGGSLVQVLGSGQRGEGENVFATPEGVALRGDKVWFSDSGNNRVVRYRMLDTR